MSTVFGMLVNNVVNSIRNTCEWHREQCSAIRKAAHKAHLLFIRLFKKAPKAGHKVVHKGPEAVHKAVRKATASYS